MIEIITHCWSKRVPIYATLLRGHLSSFLMHRPEHSKLYVCYSQTDHLVCKVRDAFKKEVGKCGPIAWVAMDDHDLGRRAIGRNLISKSTTADVVWYADCDYLFGDGCLPEAERLCKSSKEALLYPLRYVANHDKSVIDQMCLREAENFGVLPVPTNAGWVHQDLYVAIGGVQIVDGDYARSHGYLDNTKWMAPARIPFKDFRDDVVFRRYISRIGGEIQKEIPNLFRMRHTEVGYGPHAC